MGTRSLIAVQFKGKYRIAQYSQWDGYPEGQGKDVLTFLRTLDRPKFEAALKKCKFLTEKQLEKLDKTDWSKTHPHLSRDLGSKILGAVRYSDGLPLKNSIDFAGDSLYCEWAWVIDLDKNTFEAFEGYNKKPVDDDERFGSFEPRDTSSGTYHPVKFVRSWSLDALPTDEEFLESFLKVEANA